MEPVQDVLGGRGHQVGPTSQVDGAVGKERDQLVWLHPVGDDGVVDPTIGLRDGAAHGLEPAITS